MAPELPEISAEEFKRRRALSENGTKWLWYWPDVEPADWNRALLRLEATTRAVLAGEPAYLGETEDLMALSVAAYTSGMGPLVGCWIEQGKASAAGNTADLFALHLDHNRRRMATLGEAARQILDQLAARRIEATVLKGMHTAYAHFPDPAARPASDIDLLIARSECAEAFSIFEDAGFERIGEAYKETTWALAGGRRTPRSLLLVHADDPWTIDLHHSMDQKPTPGAALTRLDTAIDPYHVRGWPLDPCRKILAQPALLLNLATHIGASIEINPSLLRLTELVLVIRADVTAGRLDWSEFLVLARTTRSLRLAYPGLALAEKLAPGIVPADVLEACAQASTRRARNLIAALTPATAQRLERKSIWAHYMWAKGPAEFVRQIAADLWPNVSFSGLIAHYRRLFRRVVRGAYTR